MLVGSKARGNDQAIEQGAPPLARELPQRPTTASARAASGRAARVYLRPSSGGRPAWASTPAWQAGNVPQTDPFAGAFTAIGAPSPDSLLAAMQAAPVAAAPAAPAMAAAVEAPPMESVESAAAS